MKRCFSPSKEKEICQLYFEDQLNTHELAKQFQCAHSTIKHLIKRSGFKLRSRSEIAKSRLGAKNSNWKGGKRFLKGYVMILKPDHPNADMRGYVREHRLIMEKHLDRLLNPEEVVHHINGNLSDNRIENLTLFSGHSEHESWHQSKRRETKLLQKDFYVNS